MHPTISTSTVTTDVHLPLHSCFTCHQPCRTHLIILPSHTGWLKVPEKDIPSMALSHKPSVKNSVFKVVDTTLSVNFCPPPDNLWPHGSDAEFKREEAVCEALGGVLGLMLLAVQRQ